MIYTKCFQGDDREVQKSKLVVYNANKIRTEKSEIIVSVDAESTVKFGEGKDRIRKRSDKDCYAGKPQYCISTRQ